MTDTENNISILNVGGTAFNVKDAAARTAITAAEGRITANETDISTLKASATNGAHFLGKIDLAKTEALVDGAHTAQVYVVGAEAAKTPSAGDFVIQASGSTTLEFIWDGVASDPEGEFAGTWREFGSTGSLKAMAFVDKAQVTVKPEGTVSVASATVETESVTDPTFVGTAAVLTGKFAGTTDQVVSVAGTPDGEVSQPTFTGTEVTPTASFTGTEGNVTADFTPEGTVSAPTVSVKLATSTFKNLTASADAATETLTLTTPDVTFATGTVDEAKATAPTFTGTAGTASGTFTPTGKVAVDAITPAGTVSKPTFTGAALTSTGKFTPSGTITMDEYTPAGTNSGTAVTLKAHNHGATFEGTEATLEVTPKNA